MNETIKTLCERRSCRKFKPEQISAAELDAVLQAGLYAPNGMGRQATALIAVQDKATRDALSRMNADVMGTNTDPFYGAPTVIVVLTRADVRTGVEDGSAVLCNLANAAASLGLGSCWIHRAKEEFESEEGKALLARWGLAGEWRGVGHCILGYAVEAAAPAAPREASRIIKV